MGLENATSRQTHLSRRSSISRRCVPGDCHRSSGPTDGGLAAGKAQIWLCPVSETFNIDSFTMEGVAASSAAYGGIPPTVPGLIEAEGFDVGGQGVAYYDKTPANTGNVRRLL